MTSGTETMTTTTTTSTTCQPADQANEIQKSDESTETLETEELSESTSRVSFDEYKEMLDSFNDRITIDEAKQQQPTGEPSHDSQISFGDYTDMVDKMNQDLNADTQHSSATAESRSHFAGVWYPECKDCHCCEGFKFGCNCAPSNDGVCMCVTGGLSHVTGYVPDDVSVMTTNSTYEAWNQSFSSFSSQCRPINAQRRRSKRRSKPEREPINTNSPCRFFLSEMGCRYGDNCPFNHTK